jgi:hypothetical protein
MAIRGHLGVRYRRGQLRAAHAAQRPLGCAERQLGRPHGTRVLLVRLAVHRPAHPSAPPARSRDPPSCPDDGRCGRLALQARSPVSHRSRSPFRVAVVMPSTCAGIGQAHRQIGSSVRNVGAPSAPDRRCHRRGHGRRGRRCRPCQSQRPDACTPGPPHDSCAWQALNRPWPGSQERPRPKRRRNVASRRWQCGPPALSVSTVTSGTCNALPGPVCPAGPCASAAGHRRRGNELRCSWNSRATSSRP